MNIYALVILASLLIFYGLQSVADILNIRGMSPDLPPEFEGVWDAKAYAASQDYLRTTTRFGLAKSTWDLLVLLAFWFLGGFNALDQGVRGLGFGPVGSGLVYIGALSFLMALMETGFSIYATFGIEKHFGFNTTTPLTFMTDRLKMALLSVCLGGPVLAALIAFFEHAGPWAWLYCWIAATGFLFIVQLIAPTWIMPLFNKFEPLEEGDLKEAMLSYARSVAFSLANVFVIDGSRRTRKTNAFFMGFGKRRRVALFDTLVAEHSVPELVAVLAHEVGHYKKKHLIQALCIGIVHMGLLFYILSIFLSHEGLFQAFYMENLSVYTGLIFFGLLFTPVESLLSIFLNMLSRKNEYAADAFASETTHSPQAMTDALKRLSLNNLANLTPHRVFVFLNYSHPPILQRIKALQA